VAHEAHVALTSEATRRVYESACCECVTRSFRERTDVLATGYVEEK
jgi:hypothetical protein